MSGRTLNFLHDRYIVFTNEMSWHKLFHNTVLLLLDKSQEIDIQFVKQLPVYMVLNFFGAIGNPVCGNMEYEAP